MRSIKSLALCSIAAALLVACGGGGNGDQSPKIKFSSMVTFGDSLSDVGTYAVGGVAAANGGKYTVNNVVNGTNLSKNWTELIAAQLGLPAPCAAQTGLAATAPGYSVNNVTPAPHAGCLNYAQGGARVTIAQGTGNAALDNFAATGAVAPNNKTYNGYAALGQLTVPIVQQIANHFTAISSSTFSGTEIVTVNGGANDLFIQLAAMDALGSNVQNTFAAAAGWTGGDLTTIGTAPDPAVAAATVAVTAMGTAGATLAGYIKTQIVDKGAKYVVVSNIPNVSKTPFGLSLDPTTQALVDTMVTTFNSQLQSNLANTAGVLFVDAYTTNTDQITNQGQYGLTNVLTPACKTDSSNILAGASLACTTSNVLDNTDVSHYLFADNVHPTPFGYQLFAQLITNKLVAAGWL